MTAELVDEPDDDSIELALQVFADLEGRRISVELGRRLTAALG